MIIYFTAKERERERKRKRERKRERERERERERAFMGRTFAKHLLYVVGYRYACFYNLSSL